MVNKKRKSSIKSRKTSFSSNKIKKSSVSRKKADKHAKHGPVVDWLEEIFGVKSGKTTKKSALKRGSPKKSSSPKRKKGSKLGLNFNKTSNYKKSSKAKKTKNTGNNSGRMLIKPDFGGASKRRTKHSSSRKK